MERADGGMRESGTPARIAFPAEGVFVISRGPGGEGGGLRSDRCGGDSDGHLGWRGVPMERAGGALLGFGGPGARAALRGGARRQFVTRAAIVFPAEGGFL